MTDLALRWDQLAGTADLALEAADLAVDDGLDTAILISLFSDARADDDDELPQPGADRRGWWGDAYADVEGDATGSKLWLLSREKIGGSAIVRAREYAEAALAWLVEDGIAASVEVEVSAIRPQTLAIGVVVTRPSGPDRRRFDYVWEAMS